NDVPSKPDPSIEMTAVTADVVDGSARLEWQPVDGAVGYRVGDGGAATDVPADICAGSCSLSVNTGLVGARSELAVSAVLDDGAFSEPFVVDVDLPRPRQESEGDGENLDVLLIHGWDPDDGGDRPEVETVPVDSMEEAERIIDEAWEAESGIISASLNTSVTASTGAGDTPPSRTAGTWQVDDMFFDLLPGDPRGAGMVIAVVESGGPDASHPSLRGAVEDGVNMSDPSGTAVSLAEAHATATSSMLVGQHDAQVPGIVPGATVVPVALGEDNSTEKMVEAIIWAVDHGVDVINVSAADTNCSSADPASCPSLSAFQAATTYAEQNGVVVVASAGNNGTGDSCGTGEQVNHARLPASNDTVISVGAYAPDQSVWECTPERPDIDLLAPGVQLLHADVADGYGIANGSSLATPLVSGLIAVILSERPDLTPADIRGLLPQWRLPDGRLSVLAALASTGLLEDGYEDDVIGVYPYEIGLGFDEPHPVRELIGHAEEVVPTQVAPQMLWEGSPLYVEGGDRSDDGPYPFGVITGVVFRHEDGTYTATGEWALERMQSVQFWGSEYGSVGPFKGHTVKCVPTFVETLPAMRSIRWELPVAVDVKPVPDTGDDGGDLPDVDVTVALGTDATSERVGSLPPPVTVHDSWDRCASQSDAYWDGFGMHLPEHLRWSELSPRVDEYFETIEAIYDELVQTGPMTLSEPVDLVDSGRGGVRAHAEGTPTLLITYTTRVDD
ncbi:S8 family peptidase, partial [Phytoactinopolyspora endophytica]|uniref:S8 family peptidase n=1 Tax=Phytoactinopolyspora endophytica TaxID=1642495 RepID=UPI00197B95BA